MNIIAHVEIPVSDIDRAIRFYTAVFGIEFGPVVTIHDSRMAFFPFEAGKDGASGALACGDAYVPSRDGAIIYFQVGDVADAVAKATAQGSDVLFPKTAVDGAGFVAEISDSEGNRIALQSA